MPDSSVRQLALYLPAGLYPAGGTSPLRLNIVADEKIQGTKRAITRNFRDANASDAGRIRRVEWEMWGQIGASIYSTAQPQPHLGVDFAQNLETRWERRLTSSLQQTAVTLTGDDPPGTGSFFGTSYFGTPTYFGSNVSGLDVTVFDEMGQYLFAERGPVSTQVDYANWSVVNSHTFPAYILDSAHWYGNVYLAMGPGEAIQRRIGAGADGSTYEDVTATSPAGLVYASAIKRGSDRAWYIDASIGANNNFAGFTLDGFVNLASPFQVGDPKIGVNGIGPFGPLTDFGADDNIYSFTDQGKPVPLSKALDAIHSDLNGSQFADPGFGWLYYISVTGLRAHALPGYDNPVGVGERMRSFTGHNGIPIAIFAARGELWVIYQTSAGNIYGYRGVFGPETASTGQPLFFPWFYEASATSKAIFSSTYPNGGTQNITIIRADGTNLKYMTISGDGRDDLAGLTYSTAGGTWYGTTLDKDPNLLKTARLVRVRSRNITSGSSFAVALGFDTDPIAPTSATYTTIGTITTNGQQTIEPVSGGAPLSSISGHTIKPRIVQVAAGSGASTTPPELDGTLELEYDERPDQIEEVDVVVLVDSQSVSQNYLWDTLRQLVGSSTNGPFQIQLPDDLPPGVPLASGGGTKYAMIAGVTARTDITDNSIEAATLHLQVWPQANAI